MLLSRSVSLGRSVRFTCRQVVRCFSDKNDGYEEYVPPPGSYRSPIGMMKKEWKSLFSYDSKDMLLDVPRHSDFLIIGGGLIGSCVAYWLKTKFVHASSVSIIEKDFGYTQASSMLSVGGVRHQFSQPENVQMSMFTSEFLKNIREHLSIFDQDPQEVQFHHHGYLFLAPKERVEHLQDCVKMQREQGAKTVLLTKTMLKEKFPWLNVDGIEVGSYGTEGEGWFDPYQLVCALRAKNLDAGVNYFEGEVIRFRHEEIDDRNRIVGVDVKHKNGTVYGCNASKFINCAGPWAGQISDMAGIGTGERSNTAKLHVEPRKRYVYCFHCPNGPTLDTPLTVDPSGVYFRREGLGGHYLCGASPLTEEDEPDIGNLDVDYDFFYNHIWPILAKRVPAFECLKLKSAWAGFYDYNTLDQNLIIGPHPYHQNFVFANGLSGHGIQQGLAIGRAIGELFLDSHFKTIDLSDYDFRRVEQQTPLQELAIV